MLITGVCKDVPTKPQMVIDQMASIKTFVLWLTIKHADAN